MRSFLLFISFIFLFHFGYSQNDTIIYYKGNNIPALGKEDAIRYVKVKKKKENVYEHETYYKSHGIWKPLKERQLVYIKNDSLLRIKVTSGILRSTVYRKYKKQNKGYYIKDCDSKKGKIRVEGFSKTLLVPHWEGQVKTYYESGRLESISIYKNNQMIGNDVWMNKGSLHFKDVFESVDIAPQFLEDDQALKKYIERSVRLPVIARENGLKGCVIVKFVVDEAGDLMGVCVYRKVAPCLDHEALRIARGMCMWTPGLLDGKAVKVAFTVPINFRLR